MAHGHHHATHTKTHAHKHHEPPAHVTAFINSNLIAAKAVSAKHGVPVSIILAQAAQESGWGKRVIGNAYFGVKGRAPDGASVNIATHEDTAQGHIGINANFRAYKDFSDAADDYGATLKRSFPTVFANKNSPAQFAEALQRAHYATDPKYAAKLKAIIKSNNLEQYDLK